uniref:Uncharacterized protein n=1 Tax=Ditylenchus dipsaci TaxID=166011 RepID=A0A915EU86_9BILA
MELTLVFTVFFFFTLATAADPVVQLAEYEATVSEDCLFFECGNSSEPPPAVKKYPVLVWIHGGGWHDQIL